MGFSFRPAGCCYRVEERRDESNNIKNVAWPASRGRDRREASRGESARVGSLTAPIAVTIIYLDARAWNIHFSRGFRS
jgi:hypothetical protein